MSETPVSGGNRLAVNRLSPALGAEIRGVDLAEPVDDDLFAAIHDALLAHQVLVFPDQDVTANQQIAFSRRFGPVQSYGQIHVLASDTRQCHLALRYRRARNRPPGAATN